MQIRDIINLLIARKKKIILNGREVECIFKQGGRSRSIRLAVHPGGEFIATYPSRTNLLMVEKFIQTKASWVLKNIDKMSGYKKVSKAESRSRYLQHKEEARKVILERLEYYCKIYRLKYHKIYIKNQKGRWGSCSKNGNLNFNYKLLFLSEKQRDYVVVHELCHLKEMNHSQRFWDLVARTFPDYKKIRKQLRNKKEVIV